MSLEQALAENTAAMKELTAALLAAGALQTAQASAALHSSPGVQAVVAAQKAADAANRRANPPGDEHASVDDARAASQEQSRTASALAAAKKQDAAASAASAGAAATTESKPSGATSAQTPEKSSAAQQPGARQPWTDHTAEIYAELKDAEPTLENVKRLIVTGINSKIPGDGRAIAEAVLARFAANAVSEKPGKKGLSADQYPDVFAYGLRVLAGEIDPRDSEQAEA